MIETQPRFIQGIFPFAGAGYDQPVSLAAYTVAADRRAQPIYLRAGNSTDVLISLVLSCDGKQIRLFPIGARAAAHVQLAVVEDIPPDSVLQIAVVAPVGTEGVIVVDFGLVEI